MAQHERAVCGGMMECKRIRRLGRCQLYAEIAGFVLLTVWVLTSKKITEYHEKHNMVPVGGKLVMLWNIRYQAHHKPLQCGKQKGVYLRLIKHAQIKQNVNFHPQKIDVVSPENEDIIVYNGGGMM